MGFAPKRRAAQPVSGMTAASESKYPVSTHWIEASDEFRSRLSVASATLTIVVSRMDMIEPSTTTEAMRQTWGSMRNGASSLTGLLWYLLVRNRKRLAAPPGAVRRPGADQARTSRNAFPDGSRTSGPAASAE